MSNIDGQNPGEADGKGSIGKVGLDGKGNRSRMGKWFEWSKRDGPL